MDIVDDMEVSKLSAKVFVTPLITHQNFTDYIECYGIYGHLKLCTSLHPVWIEPLPHADLEPASPP